MIETYSYARAGLLGNPSDGFFGKTIAFLVRNFRARVLLYPSARLEIRLSKADTPVFENLDDLYRTTRWRGYYGGVRLIQASLVRFIDYCRENGIKLEDRNFAIEYETSIPLRLGLGGSSSIITAALRALMQYFNIQIPLPIQANLALETETRELGVSAGLQDRVVQAYEGMVFMDFSREIMERNGYGNYERLDANLLPPTYVAYRRSLSEGTEVLHNDLRARWRAGEGAVVSAMHRWAEIAEEGRQALLDRDYDRLDRLVNENFDLRSRICQISKGNAQMIEKARACGVSANFTGSGGAIVGTYRIEEDFQRLKAAMAQIQVEVIRPQVTP